MRLRRIERVLWDVLAVCRDRGDCPLLEFLASLEADLVPDRDRMLAALDRAAVVGPSRLGREKSKKLRDDIYELVEGRLRIVWFYGDGRAVICSHGFVKKTRKAPRAEIERAERELARYVAAVEAGEIQIDDETEE